MTEDCSPTITGREYVAALANVLATCTESPRWRCYRCRLGLRYLALGLPGPASLVFAGLVRQYPDDKYGHRLLGVAHLSCGELESAVKHLEIALGLVRRKTEGVVGLTEALGLQCEAALLRLVLVRLHMKLGQHQAACWLVREAHELL